MDPQSITDQTSAASLVEKENEVVGASGPELPSVSARIAQEKAQAAKLPEGGPRFPGEDNGRSLVAMAYRDLDAALQLLAERAQYITGASGAMIALRRGEHNDMLCRATAGAKAPDLGALLSMEHGFSGESVRTRQALRCDDAEIDPRVNREGCRSLGISSVVAMPILSDQQVLGVFELFSGKAHAFDERDLSALQRLGEMVETAVKYAVAAQAATVVEEPPALTAKDDDLLLVETNLEVETVKPKVAELVDSTAASANLASAKDEEDVLEVATENVELGEKKHSEATESLKPEAEKVEIKKAAEVAPKKPLFWSAESSGSIKAEAAAEEQETDAPAVLKTFRKCEACGFPVSQGRTLCVECEEKQWRGQRGSQPAAGAERQVQSPASSSKKSTTENIAAKRASAATIDRSTGSEANSVPIPLVAAAAVPTAPALPLKSAVIARHSAAAGAAAVITLVPESAGLKAESSPASENSTLFLSANVDSPSWLASNKYIVGALVLVAIIVAAFFLLR